MFGCEKSSNIIPEWEFNKEVRINLKINNENIKQRLKSIIEVALSRILCKLEGKFYHQYDIH